MCSSFHKQKILCYRPEIPFQLANYEILRESQAVIWTFLACPRKHERCIHTAAPPAIRYRKAIAFEPFVKRVLDCYGYSKHNLKDFALLYQNWLKTVACFSSIVLGLFCPWLNIFLTLPWAVRDELSLVGFVSMNDAQEIVLIVDLLVSVMPNNSTETLYLWCGRLLRINDKNRSTHACSSFW